MWQALARDPGLCVFFHTFPPFLEVFRCLAFSGDPARDFPPKQELIRWVPATCNLLLAGPPQCMSDQLLPPLLQPSSDHGRQQPLVQDPRTPLHGKLCAPFFLTRGVAQMLPPWKLIFALIGGRISLPPVLLFFSLEIGRH